jgi:Glycosyltransferase WbsX
MKNLKFLKQLPLVVAVVFSLCNIAQAQNKDIKVGAYYFDGWTGHSAYHLNNKLTDNFPERQPIWGWITSKQNVMEEQIKYASAAGIDFFNFCWYSNPKNVDSLDNDVKNTALKLYLHANNKDKLGFAILVVDDPLHTPTPETWPTMVKYWVDLFKDPMYLKIDGKPYISFISAGSISKAFGGPENVKKAMNELREAAKREGMEGVTIGVCLTPNQKWIDDLNQNDYGFDLVTGYNYHDAGFHGSLNQVEDIADMTRGEQGFWTKLKNSIPNMKQIPVVTVNWDRRPLDIGSDKTYSRFTGLSGNSVKMALMNVRRWIKHNPSAVNDDKVINVYAWNEYGEGGYLTPSSGLGNALLEGFKAGLEVPVN